MQKNYIDTQIAALADEYSEELIEFSKRAFDKFSVASAVQSTSVAVRKAADECMFTLGCGRVITLTQVSQHFAQRNVYEGLQHPCASIADAVKTAEVVVGKLERMPVVLKTEVFTGSFSSSAADAWLALPAVSTIAVFESNYYVRDPDATSSALTLIWFQPNFGLQISEDIAEQITAIDWTHLANDHFL